MRFTTRAASETQALARALGALLRAGDVVLLSGDLGAGKTTFTKGVAEALGVKEPVTSPTFTIVQEYEGSVPIAHVDVFRLQRVQELYDLGFEELLEGRVVLVEWGDLVAPVLPAERVEVTFTIGDDLEMRDVEIAAFGPSWSNRGLDDALAASGIAQ
jgi:tRNA threonylcarbamoyladenosine biosynthesis protein TsaE